MPKILFNKVAIVGVGLIGGSLGMAIRKKRLAREVVGLNRRRKTSLWAIKHGAIDKGSSDPKNVAGADLIILATPVETIINIIPQLRRFIKPGCIVTDVGSCKKRIVSILEERLPAGTFFVGSHPLAGSEKKGVNFAQPDLFKDTLCIVTVTKRTDIFALRRLKGLWASLGAKVHTLDPAAHDKILAFLSHLPHALAFSLIRAVPAAYLRLSPRSLKDATRIASSDPLVWKGIFLMNAENVTKAINVLQLYLKGFKRLLARKDGQGLLKILRQAKAKRDLL